MIEHHIFDKSEVDSVVISCDIAAGVRDVLVAVAEVARGEMVPRAALFSYRLIDERGNVIAPEGRHFRSMEVGYFFYLESSEVQDVESTYTLYEVPVPTGAVRIELQGRTWAKVKPARIDEVYIIGLDDEGLTSDPDPEIPDWVLERTSPRLGKRWSSRFTDRAPIEPGNNAEQTAWSIAKEIVAAPLDLDANRQAYRSHGPKEAHKFKVALICDEFTFNSISPEFDYVVLEPDNWQELMEEFRPDFLFCESAWSGVDSTRRPWRGQIYSSIKFQWENRGTLLQILAHCKTKAIPTVFWNKEDPTHFHDRVNDFVSTASRFDYILTTAEEMVEEYSKFHSPSNVGVLQFAAQPRDFNPLGANERAHRAVFAGAWYDVHEERSVTMRRGLDAVIEADIPLLIHDRNKRSHAAETNFPRPYDDHVVPAISHKQTARLYRTSTLGLNFNTVVNSKTMFARRVFELAASGAMIVSNYSPGIERIYGDSVLFYDRPGPQLSELSAGDIGQMARETLRETLLRHTYRQRFEQILTHLGLSFTSSRPAPTMMTIVKTEEAAREAVRAFTARSQDFSRLLLVISREVSSSSIGQYLSALNDTNIDVVSQELIATESVPSTNFLATPDVIWVDVRNIPSAEDIETLMLHGEYSRLPMMLHESDEDIMAAGSLRPGMRLPAIDVVAALTDNGQVHPVLKVAR